jgi:HD-GYP domain-containing protein (c-di-GMP phosphodiesterase class II)
MAAPVDQIDPAQVRESGQALLAALEARFPGSTHHAESTATYSFAIAAELGLPRRRCELLREIARLHDVGKVYLPRELVLKPGSLSDDERRELRAYPEAGFKLLVGAGVPEDAAHWALDHREHIDGSGYPRGLGGEEIPREARIIGVACAYDAVRSDRPYYRGIPRRLALTEIRRSAGTQLDPAVVGALVSLVERATPSARP